jgi:Domain of unknown function (DUF4384)
MNAALRHLSPYELDGLHIGVMDGARAQAARNHLEGCVRCRRMAGELRSWQEHFSGEIWPTAAGRLRTHLARRPEPRRRWRWMALAFLPLAASGAMAALYLRPRAPDSPVTAESTAATIGVKGAPAWLVVARRQGRVFPASSETPLAAGDQLRFVVNPGELPYVMVASIDGAGRPSVYFPFGSVASGRVPTGRRLELPGSLVLDDAPGPERLYALFSRAPLRAEVVTAALREVAAGGVHNIRRAEHLAVPADAQRSFLLEKLPEKQP